jgi:proteasome regulatory subunit
MTSDVEAIKPSGGSDENRSDEDIIQLEKDFRILHDQAQKLITERVSLESDINKLKKRTARLDEEIRLLKSPPLIIGHIQDLLNDESAIVRSSNGTVFQVAVNKRLQSENLKPGTRVALNQDTLAVTDLLHDAWDPLVSGAEMIERPEISYGEIGGLDEEVLRLREAIELPLEKPELFREVGIEPPKGVLLVGPPGCGKTMIAKAVAAQTEATFIRMVGSELAQKYIGEGGRMVRELFSLAREKSPAIIFLDEIDAIGAKRLDAATSGDREVQRTLMQLLAELDGFDALESVKIIAATNRPDILDEALLRPGRFDRIIEIPLPEDGARKAILSIHTNRMATSRISMPRLVEQTKGFSGADLKATCVEAGMTAIRDGRSKVSQKDFQIAVQTVIKKRDSNADLSAASELYA